MEALLADAGCAAEQPETSGKPMKVATTMKVAGKGLAKPSKPMKSAQKLPAMKGKAVHMPPSAPAMKGTAMKCKVAKGKAMKVTKAMKAKPQKKVARKDSRCYASIVILLVLRWCRLWTSYSLDVFMSSFRQDANYA